jgi:hypothetical protein
VVAKYDKKLQPDSKDENGNKTNGNKLRMKPLKATNQLAY